MAERWFITMGYRHTRSYKSETPYFTAYISDEHPAEFIQDCLQYDDGDYWIQCAVPYTGDLPTGEIESPGEE